MDWADKIRQLRWEEIPSLVGNWFVDLAYYYWQTMGWVGLLIVLAGVVFALLSFDMTHHMTSLVMARVINGIYMLTLGAAVLLLGLLVKYLGFTFLAKIRDSLRRVMSVRQHSES